MLQGYGLTTAEIFYRMPDHRSLLQSYIWQDYDMAPDMPVLGKFLDFWKRELEGPLHSMTLVHRRAISSTEWRGLNADFIFN